MRPGSDVEHIVALTRARGYHMPDGMMYVRLVHLLDEQRRKELRSGAQGGKQCDHF